ncbi:MAG: hypothetical protein AVO35_08300 [Candidatus Aegiribacteria sp. MLS_C]|nr:MAG: hypothetical protein AVO35_08300 [Candidatus Aegiribacteria sp. MLS_C]
MDSSVLLSTDELRVRDGSREPLDLALLAGSMLVLLGGPDTVAGDLCRVLAGRSSPFSGRVLLGDGNGQPLEKGAGANVQYVPEDFTCPPGMTLLQHLELSAAAAGHRRKRAGEMIPQVLEWCSLEDFANSRVRRLPGGTRYMAAFAAACLSIPSVMVLQGPCPPELHPLLEEFCRGGGAVVVSVPGLEFIPRSADRIALCDVNEVRRILRFGELASTAARLMRLRVRFFPALPRDVMESLPGARDIVAVSGGFEFVHGGLSAAVTNLVSLARANSRQIAGLEVRPPSIKAILNHLNLDEDTGEADLFCGEDLGI